MTTPSIPLDEQIECLDYITKFGYEPTQAIALKLEAILSSLKELRASRFERVGVIATQLSYNQQFIYGEKVTPFMPTGDKPTAVLFKELPAGTDLYARKAALPPSADKEPK